MHVHHTEKNSTNQKNHTMDICIENCLNSFKACEEALTRCFATVGHSNLKYMKLLMECAAICNISAKFMMMNSKFHHDICGVCAKICLECADSCEVLNDESMNECGEACRKCAETCAEMAKMPH